MSVIIPAFNEAATISTIISEVLDNPGTGEIIVVDDASDDGTREFLRDFSHEKVKIFFHGKNLGKGACIRTGLAECSGDIIIIQDADLEYPPEQYGMILSPLLNDKADVVYGSRFLGRHRVFMFWHYLANRFLAFLTNILYNTMLTDIETGCKAFKKEALNDIVIRSNRFNFEAEFTAKIFKKKNLRVIEIPIDYYGRSYEEGKKVGWKDGVSAVWALLKYRFTD